MDASIISAIISAVVAFTVGLIVNWQGRSQFFSTTVSRERMAWIKEIRELCSELCAVCEQYDVESIKKEPEKYAALLRARNGLLLHLSPTGFYTTDDELISLLKSPDFAALKANMPRIREIFARIIKTEWDKVKIEAGNNIWKVRRIKKLQDKLKSEKKQSKKKR